MTKLYSTSKKRKLKVTKKMKMTKLYSNSKMKKLYAKKMNKNGETEFNERDEERSFKCISNYLLFALQKGLSKSIVDILMTALKPLDIVDLVNYKVANDEQRKVSKRANDDSEDHDFPNKLM